MAIIRNTVDSDNPVNYVATLAFFCCVSCVVLMLKFRGFRARFNVSTSTKDDDVPVVSMSGAYRVKAEEFFESGRTIELPKKITPSMVKLPLNNNMKPSKSTSDMREPEFVPVTMHKSTQEISFDPRGGKSNIPEVELRNPEKSLKESKKEEKEKIKLEKKLQADQKAREKAAQEQAKKERIKQEKVQAKQAKTKDKKEKKTKAVAPPAPPAPPLPQSSPPQASTAPKSAQRQPLAPTSSLHSNINRSSGPPPYSELPQPINLPPNSEKPNTSNVSFGKPINNTTSSWDLVNQHRQQMGRPTATIGGGGRKQMVMDLQYNFDKDVDKDNTEA